MLICNRCGRLCEEEDLPVNSESEEIMGYKQSWTIPDFDCSCGGEFVNAVECSVCGDWVDSEKFVHDECNTFENAIEVGAKYKENVKLNGYLTFEFTPEEIEEILIRELRDCKGLSYRHYLAWECFDKDLKN